MVLFCPCGSCRFVRLHMFDTDVETEGMSAQPFLIECSRCRTIFGWSFTNHGWRQIDEAIEITNGNLDKFFAEFVRP